MKYNPDIHHRRSIRLQGCDYSQAGTYFVTICTHARACVFGQIADRQMVLNDAGRMVASVWGQLPIRFDRMDLDDFVVMPNHIHCIFVLCRRGEPCVRPVSPGNQTSGEHKVRPYDDLAPARDDHASGEHKVRPYGTLPNSVGRVIQAFKSITTHEYTMGVKHHGWPPYPGKLWQRNYYERIIRNEDELNRIRQYIVNNPKKWGFDRENPGRPAMDHLHRGMKRGGAANPLTPSTVSAGGT
jgi:putative transposase